MSEIILRIKDLKCGYDDKTVLYDINIDIKKGALVGIIGPNGSGKTTLLKAISKVLKPDSGNIMLNTMDIRYIKIKEFAQKIAVVPQRFESTWHTVEDFVLMGRMPYLGRFQFLEKDSDVEIAKKYMKLSGIFDLRDKQMEQISGGERQLALITRALVQEPELLLLDEPTAHLDISHQVEIMDLVVRLNRELGITVIVVLHDLNLASDYCSRLIIIDNGKIYKSGTPEEVLHYDTIEEVYKTVVVVKKNPLTAKPFVYVVPEEFRKT